MVCEKALEREGAEGRCDFRSKTHRGSFSLTLQGILQQELCTAVVLRAGPFYSIPVRPCGDCCREKETVGLDTCILTKWLQGLKATLLSPR